MPPFGASANDAKRRGATADMRSDTRPASHGRGTIRYLASAAKREMFSTDPARYAPACGGNSGIGVAVGTENNRDLVSTTCGDGLPYLNVSDRVRSMWPEDIAVTARTRSGA